VISTIKRIVRSTYRYKRPPRRVGDLADALWRDMVRRITDKGQQ
jgi:hypothetical protein